MAEVTPVKCANDAHRPFAADDTVAPEVLNLSELVVGGTGITITVNNDGTLTLTNTCCP